ncbi:hypothetical protein E6P09_18245 (plasmid) [Haloferax mediterranei ATCC 33500]|uniref:Uncharacterized protein n=1 Tax=Haloferax mediterranei (strain ATCC 33500 / DSM 1411 / JCM 8866 / NBRC 14739 / NCIMB 2177 / R-4) TaxID=523841 RepID=I3RA50_HALMT|nr:hypothetical protein [Haloferax mediterranei]AFK21110.1 hypothetical protein HFX_5279 [Haloferax mediterranei ATCC 33500]AHZ24303.1 hypothetical protein BM92_19080 [Haloferax mediterranei ATCC 33500]EMA05389.1 hypothetical protein C439_01280 [Haloferax mediterranei ATCC 33500]MDX5989813.1 hypothetical protein [Haloferax mediterranei ATCC 33500]QCQ77255.1 hypothetical protein E6P09_18245 [Haloferax mediterranei ATCC 33500]
MSLSPVVWASMILTIIVLPGVASVVLVKSLRSEERKLTLLKEQDQIDSYSPRALADLREWIEKHPDDPYTPVARDRYNECVETLREIEEPYYDWSEAEINQLQTIDK